jgi:hypothetical protein
MPVQPDNVSAVIPMIANEDLLIGSPCIRTTSIYGCARSAGIDYAGKKA